MARVLDDGNMRVLPILGKGPVRNVVDILNLKTIDMGMVVSDVPEFYRLQYKSDRRHPPRPCPAFCPLSPVPRPGLTLSTTSLTNGSRAASRRSIRPACFQHTS